ncbi:MAG: CHAT domain-containing protein [Deltaproteobacteria bacterium]
MLPRKGIAALVVIAAIAAYAAIRGADDPAPRALTASRPAPPGEVLVSGCSEVRSGGQCEIEPGGELVLWVAQPASATVAVSLDDRPLERSIRRVQDGWQLRTRPPNPGGASGATLVTRANGRVVAELRVTPSTLHPEIKRARELRSGQDLDQALDVITSLLDAPEASVRAHALGLRGRIRYWRGEVDAGIDDLRASIELATQAGLLQTVTDDRAAAAHFLTREARFAEATAMLEPLGAIAADFHDAAPLRSYYLSNIAFDYGDFRTALSRQLDTIRLAERLGIDWLLVASHSLRAGLLLRMGRFADARRHDALALQYAGGEPCVRAATFYNGAFHGVLEAEALGATTPPEVLDRLRQAVAMYAADCPRAATRANALVALGRGYINAGDDVSAQTALDEAERLTSDPSPREALDRIHLKARIQTRVHAWAEATRSYQTMASLAELGDIALFRWFASVGLAEVAIAQGARDRAIRHLEEAERLVDEKLLVIPFGEGRDASIRLLSKSARMLVGLQAEHGAPEETARAARRSRRRALQILDWASRVAQLDPMSRTRWYEALAKYRAARDAGATGLEHAWTLSGKELDAVKAKRAANVRAVSNAFEQALAALARDARDRDARLRPPDDDEVLLLFHPTSTGWVGFSIDTSRTVMRRIESADLSALDERALARRLLSPFARAIRRARRVTILPYGALLSVDFHALPFDGSALVAQREVVYGADLAPRPPRRVEARRRALIVGDPAANLPRAREEAKAVHRLLVDARWDTELLLGGDADLPTVRSHLERPGLQLAHFAGHARLSAQDGFESELGLAKGTALTMTDILAFARVPPHVFLAGCETADSSHDAGQSLALAHAFLLSGAEVVVGASRAIADDHAKALVSKLYRGTSPDDLARMYQRSVHGADPTPEWQSLRVFVR